MAKKDNTVMPYKSYNCITISQKEIDNFVSNYTEGITTDEYVETYSYYTSALEFCKHVPIVKAYFKLFKDLNYWHSLTPWEYRKAIYKNGSGGGIIGGIIDNLLPNYVTTTSSYTFRHGEDNIEVDCICIEFSFPNFENKTTGCEKGKLQKISGSKTQAANTTNGSTKYTNDEWHFYVFCAYHIPIEETDILIINDIYVGVLKRSQWKCSEDSKGSGSASIDKEIFEKQFFNVYHREIKPL